MRRDDGILLSRPAVAHLSTPPDVVDGGGSASLSCSGGPSSHSWGCLCHAPPVEAMLRALHPPVACGGAAETKLALVWFGVGLLCCVRVEVGWTVVGEREGGSNR